MTELIAAFIPAASVKSTAKTCPVSDMKSADPLINMTDLALLEKTIISHIIGYFFLVCDSCRGDVHEGIT